MGENTPVYLSLVVAALMVVLFVVKPPHTQAASPSSAAAGHSQVAPGSKSKGTANFGVGCGG